MHFEQPRLSVPPVTVDDPGERLYQNIDPLGGTQYPKTGSY